MMADVTNMEQLESEIKQMTDEVNKETFDLWKRKFEEGDMMTLKSLLSDKWNDNDNDNSSLTVCTNVCRVSKTKIKNITSKQLSLQRMFHHQCLIDDDDNCCDIINKCHPPHSDTADKILDVLKLVSDKIACQYPCHLIRAGSFSDGTKIDKLNEMDFIFVLKYNSSRDYNLITNEYVYGNLECVITPSVDSDLHQYCRHDNGTLDVERFRDDFKNALSRVIQDSCREMGVNFGGFLRPNFSLFRENDPAFTVKLEDISVDFTVAFRVPSHVMYEILHRKCRPDILKYIKRHIRYYLSLGLAVITDFDYLDLSTSLLERNIIRHNRVIRQTLIVMKYYKDHLFNIFPPSFGNYYKEIIKTVRDDICRLIQENGNFGEKYEKYLRLTNRSEEYLERAIIIHEAVNLLKRQQVITSTSSQQHIPSTSIQQESSLTSNQQDITSTSSQQYISSTSRQQLDDIEQRCTYIVNRLIGKRYVRIYPSLLKIIDEEVKPVATTKSYIFKILIIKQYFNNTEMSTSQCIKGTLLNYCQQFVHGIGRATTIHPFLGSSFSLISISDWIINTFDLAEDTADDYIRHVIKIVDRDTSRDTDTSRDRNTCRDTDTSRDRDTSGDTDRSRDRDISIDRDTSGDTDRSRDRDIFIDRDTSGDTDRSRDRDISIDRDTSGDTDRSRDRDRDRDNGGDYILKKRFHIEDKYLDTRCLYDILDICYLDNNHLIVVTKGSLHIITKDGDKVNHPLLDGRDTITVFDIEGGEGRRSDMWRRKDELDMFTSVSVNKKEDVIVMTETMGKDDRGYLNVWNLVSNKCQFNRYKICQDPHCVGIMSNGQYVVCSRNGCEGLYKYNESCKIIWYNRAFYNVDDLTVNNNNDNIIVSYRYEGVFVIDSDGDFLLSISYSSSLSLSSYPQCLSVDKEGNLFICDSKSILLFNHQYQFVKKLVTTKYEPYRVALYDNKYMAICGKYSNIVNIYCTIDNNDINDGARIWMRIREWIRAIFCRQNQRLFSRNSSAE